MRKGTEKTQYHGNLRVPPGNETLCQEIAGLIKGLLTIHSPTIIRPAISWGKHGIGSENQWLEDERPFGKAYFQGRTVSFTG